MDEKLSRRIQAVCAWAGVAFCVAYGITWLALPHNFPPPDPGYTGQELVDNYYLKYQDRILLGMTLSAGTGVLYVVWSTQLTVQMWRREPAPVLSLLQFAGGVLTGWVLLFPPALWAWSAKYAGEVDPEMIKMVHMVAWYLFDITYWVTTIECIAIFLLVLKDRAKPALLPKWVGWFSLISGLSFLPLTAMPYFETGPLALNGWWNFHVAFAAFGVFTSVASYYMVKDAKRQPIPATPGLAQAISRSQTGS